MKCLVPTQLFRRQASLLLAFVLLFPLAIDPSVFGNQPPVKDRTSNQESKADNKKDSRPKPNVEKQSDEPSAGPQENKDDWFSRWVRGRAFYKFRKNSSQIRQVFDPVSSSAGTATVQVLCNGKPTILGLVVDSSGLVLTKASELKGKISCRLGLDKSSPAKIVGIHPQHDLALLSIDANALPTAKWNTEPAVSVGSWVIAPGSDGTAMAVGIMSAQTRWIRGGVLGVFLEPSAGGPKIVGLTPKGGGGKAGLQRGDVIKQINGKPVRDVDAAIFAIGSYLPGDRVELTIARGRKSVEITATLDSVHKTFGNTRALFQNSLGVSLSDRRAGFPSALEHDLVLTPSQCGGPLVNLQGDIIGLNIARSGRVSSLAVPADVIFPLIEEMKSGKWAPVDPKVAAAIDDLTEKRAEVQSQVGKAKKELEKTKAVMADTRSQLEDTDEDQKISLENSLLQFTKNRRQLKQQLAELDKQAAEIDIKLNALRTDEKTEESTSLPNQ